MTTPNGFKSCLHYLLQGLTVFPSEISPSPAQPPINTPILNVWTGKGQLNSLSTLNYDSLCNLMDKVWHQENVISPSNQPHSDLSVHCSTPPNVGSNCVPILYTDTASLSSPTKKVTTSVKSMDEGETLDKSIINTPELSNDSKLEREEKSDGDLYKLRRRKAKSRRRTKPLRRSASVDMYGKDSDEGDIPNRFNSESIDDSPPLFVKNNKTITRGSITIGSNYPTLGYSIQEEEYNPRSLTDADLEELKGFCDLGFEFPRDKLNPRVTATLPALKLLHAVEDVQERLIRHMTPKATNPSHVFPSQIDHSVHPLGEPWMVPSYNNKTADMKMHLKVWAQAVACTVRQAC